MVRHNEHSIKFVQLTDLLQVLQLTFADVRPDKSIKQKKRENSQNYIVFFYLFIFLKISKNSLI